MEHGARVVREWEGYQGVKLVVRCKREGSNGGQECSGGGSFVSLLQSSNRITITRAVRGRDDVNNM